MHELVIDNFAGGGGASTGISMALGRPVDIAINHDALAIAMHMANHPGTRHLCENVWKVEPAEVTNGASVALCWLSPDCKHFSKAKGGKPVEKHIRGLAWVAVRWAATVRPRVIMLENVEEFKTWGPLLENGMPCPARKGRTFRAFVNALKRHGYAVEWRELRACDYGAPTTRKRLFLVARCDGRPIAWPEPTHGDPENIFVRTGVLKPWRTAAEIIDWTIPCPSIFERRKPLAENTLRRIARGIQKFVIDNPEPFIVRIGQTGFGADRKQYPIDSPLTTVTSKAEHLLVSPTLINIGYGELPGQALRCPGLNKPLGTVVSGGKKHALVQAFIAKNFGGGYTGPGADLNKPLPTVTGKDHNALVTSHLVKLRGTCRHGQPVTKPMPTITAGGTHVGEVRAFLLKYYGIGEGQNLRNPTATVTTKDRFGLVTVQGQDYEIVDIGMRMLEPHELFAAQGFPADYIIDHGADGRKFSKSDQVAKCGNAVCPQLSEALVRANLPEMCTGGGEDQIEQAMEA